MKFSAEPSSRPYLPDTFPGQMQKPNRTLDPGVAGLLLHNIPLGENTDICHRAFIQGGRNLTISSSQHQCTPSTFNIAHEVAESDHCQYPKHDRSKRHFYSSDVESGSLVPADQFGIIGLLANSPVYSQSNRSSTISGSSSGRRTTPSGFLSTIRCSCGCFCC